MLLLFRERGPMPWQRLNITLYALYWKKIEFGGISQFKMLGLAMPILAYITVVSAGWLAEVVIFHTAFSIQQPPIHHYLQLVYFCFTAVLHTVVLLFTSCFKELLSCLSSYSGSRYQIEANPCSRCEVVCIEHIEHECP